MDVTYEFGVGDRVIEKATGLAGAVVICGTDDIAAVFEVQFDQRIMGRRRHWKRTTEIKPEPKRKKAKRAGK